MRDVPLCLAVGLRALQAQSDARAIREASGLTTAIDDAQAGARLGQGVVSARRGPRRASSRRCRRRPCSSSCCSSGCMGEKGTVLSTSWSLPKNQLALSRGPPYATKQGVPTSSTLVAREPRVLW